MRTISIFEKNKPGIYINLILLSASILSCQAQSSMVVIMDFYNGDHNNHYCYGSGVLQNNKDTLYHKFNIIDYEEDLKEKVHSRDGEWIEILNGKPLSSYIYKENKPAGPFKLYDDDAYLFLERPHCPKQKYSEDTLKYYYPPHVAPGKLMCEIPSNHPIVLKRGYFNSNAEECASNFYDIYGNKLIDQNTNIWIDYFKEEANRFHIPNQYEGLLTTKLYFTFDDYDTKFSTYYMPQDYYRHNADTSYYEMVVFNDYVPYFLAFYLKEEDNKYRAWFIDKEIDGYIEVKFHSCDSIDYYRFTNYNEERERETITFIELTRKRLPVIQPSFLRCGN